ncbi:nuclease-related domain-containing protein [Metabacillus fastidiosus]|uniref:nuclease-related domain-containing protein n=1 Tax=Metabacillus fastidiosus TaxID=1458 RepID=UPI002E1C9FD9|nr:nuclease-related domain-containing protein [Metabacillus fastidiosus]
MFFKFSKRKNKVSVETNQPTDKQPVSKIKPDRIGEIGEYKINIQLDQLPKDYKYLSDIIIPNSKAKSGYSQIDHIVLTPYAVFVIETKNYQGTIYGGRDRRTWSVNGKFKMLNPFHQNYGHISALKSIIPIDSSNIVSMISFTKRCTFKIDTELRNIQSNELIVYDIELSEFISRKLNILKYQNESSVYSNIEIEQIHQQIEQANIVDTKIRERHVQLLKSNVDGPTANNEGNQLDTSKCKICGAVVSTKVREYCLSNKKKFNGEIYCFNHQKLF